MRVVPTVKVRCHVCAHEFIINNRLAPGTRNVVQEPSECPRCGAPLKAVPPANFAVGQAKGLLVALVDQVGRAADLLEASVRDEADVDRIVRAALAMDYDAWERDYGDEHGVLVAEELAELASSRRARAQADLLVVQVRAVADEVRERLHAERKRRMKIAADFDARRY